MLKHKLLFLTVLFSMIMLSANAFAAHGAINNTVRLSSAEVNSLATVAAIDQDEIILGAMTLHKHAPRSVNSLAKMMIDQHGANLAEIMQLAHEYHIAALQTAMSKQFLLNGQKAVVKLGALDGKQFANAYTNAMVSGHESALKLIDTKLLPAAKTPAIKQFMTETRAAVAMHLAHAKEVQADLKS